MFSSIPKAELRLHKDTRTKIQVDSVRLFQRIIGAMQDPAKNAFNLNPLPNKSWFLRVCSTCLSKMVWGKEKLFVTSNFSFSLSVFYPFYKFFIIFLPFSTNSNVLSANSFNLEESKFCHLGKG